MNLKEKIRIEVIHISHKGGGLKVPHFFLYVSYFEIVQILMKVERIGFIQRVNTPFL